MGFKKGMISIISFVLFVGIVFSPISIQTNQSSAYAAIVEENDEIKLNLDYAKENGLSTAEVNNLQQALIGISSDDLKEIESATASLEKEILKQDDFIQINELSASAIGRHSPPPSGFEKALKLVFGAVVGMTVATLIVQDLYKLGAYSACHKWGKKKPKVKKACKALGYW
ncbi:hypothetical protein [Peribacillus frigoritolerans]|uniref:hypothetical protein n=1 Tax=Peribacillus frigoritolerans TaxID=450367 RepID=UPI003305EBF2